MLPGCAENGVDYTYIEANAIFNHTASDSGERVFLLSDRLAYVDKASGALVETDIIPAYFRGYAGGYVYCQLPSAEADSDNPNKPTSGVFRSARPRCQGRKAVF